MELSFSELQRLVSERAGRIWTTSFLSQAEVSDANALLEATMAYKKFLVAFKKSKGKK